MKLEPGYISITYQEVEYVLVRNSNMLSSEETLSLLDSDTKRALVNQKTWSHIELLAFSDMKRKNDVVQ